MVDNFLLENGLNLLQLENGLDLYTQEVRVGTTLATTVGFDRGENWTLSNGNLTGNLASGLGSIIRASQTTKVGDKIQFELIISTYTTAGGEIVKMGLETGRNNYAIYPNATPGSGDGAGGNDDSGITFAMDPLGWGLNVPANNGPGATSLTNFVTAGDVFTMEYDPVLGTVAVYKTRSGVTTLVGSVSGLASTYTRGFISGSSAANGMALTANFGATAFARPLTAGYVSYNNLSVVDTTVYKSVRTFAQVSRGPRTRAQMYLGTRSFFP